MVLVLIVLDLLSYLTAFSCADFSSQNMLNMECLYNKAFGFLLNCGCRTGSGSR